MRVIILAGIRGGQSVRSQAGRVPLVWSHRYKTYLRQRDFEGLPASQLAVFPGTSHFFGLVRTDLVLAAVVPFLDAPPPQGFGDL